MKTADELFEIIKDARVVGPDTKLIIEGNRGFYRGYAIVLINKIELKFKEKDLIQRKSDDARHLGIRRKILKIIDPKLNQNAVRNARILVPFFDLVDKIILTADTAALLKTQSEDLSVLTNKVHRVIEERLSREKNQKHKLRTVSARRTVPGTTIRPRRRTTSGNI